MQVSYSLGNRVLAASVDSGATRRRSVRCRAPGPRHPGALRCRALLHLLLIAVVAADLMICLSTVRNRCGVTIIGRIIAAHSLPVPSIV